MSKPNVMICGRHPTLGVIPVRVSEDGALVFSAGTVGGFVSAPVDNTDFSMLPGGVAPTSGQYVAIVGNTIWSIVAGETAWRESERALEEEE